MAQKILAGRAVDSAAGSGAATTADLQLVKVDQIMLATRPSQILDDALVSGLRTSSIESSVAYDGVCVTTTDGAAALGDSKLRQLAAAGFQVARSGLGFAPCVHLERFAAPGRLALTDDPRFAMLGGVGMLVLTVPPHQLSAALVRGSVEVRAPRIVQVLLSGRLRAFVSARDVGLELIRRGLEEIVRKIDAQHGAPVVLEFAGSGARMLNVNERAQIASIAPLVGAQAALFVSDEKTETFLRDQRRSKAHRALFADQGSPSDHVLSLDLATVDPVLLDADGVVRFVRDLAGRPVHQAVLGGDGGANLRDILVAAGLLKSKRVPPSLDFLIAPSSRQCLEVLAQSSALADLIATGARIIEPDRRFSSGDLYPPGEGRTSLRTSDPAPGAPFIVASTETVCIAIASGEIGDPRSFKRPVRVTVPRVLPTDDVLIFKESRRSAAAPVEAHPRASALPARWLAPLALRVAVARSVGDTIVIARGVRDLVEIHEGLVLGLSSPRAVIAAHFPSSIAASLAGYGVAALLVSDEDLASLSTLSRDTQLALPPLDQLAQGAAVEVDGRTLTIRWVATDAERDRWTDGTVSTAPDAGSATSNTKASKPVRKKSAAS